jgi:hypothetical protein
VEVIDVSSDKYEVSGFSKHIEEDEAEEIRRLIARKVLDNMTYFPSRIPGIFMFHATVVGKEKGIIMVHIWHDNVDGGSAQGGIPLYYTIIDFRRNGDKIEVLVAIESEYDSKPLFYIKDVVQIKHGGK